MVIYKITNKINGKVYVGQTIGSIYSRFKSHTYKSSKCTKLYNSIKKYGKENFKIEIIEKCNSMKELNKREEYWISKLNTIEDGYNLQSGGNNRIPCKETREKLSKIGKVAQNRPETIKRSIETSINMWKNPKYKAKMSKIFSKLADSDKMSEKASKLWKNEKSREKAIKNSRKTRLKNFSKPFKVYKAVKEKHNVYIKGEFVGIWENKSVCAEDLQISDKNISSTLNGKYKSCKGYIFEYI
jgi:group I intron endonuclease